MPICIVYLSVFAAYSRDAQLLDVTIDQVIGSGKCTEKRIINSVIKIITIY